MIADASFRRVERVRAVWTEGCRQTVVCRQRQPEKGSCVRDPAGRRGNAVRLLLVGGGEVAQWAQVGVRGLSEGVAAVEVLVDQR